MSGITLEGLNHEQRKIAETLDAPLFVQAGAGSGKTFTLTRRVAWALSDGSGEGGAPFLESMSQVLIITFTNAAAREIKERVRSTLRDAGMNEHALQVDSAWISTIHGMCKRIIARHALDLGLDPDFSVASTNLESTIETTALREVVGAVYDRRGESPVLAGLFDDFGFGGVDARGASGVCGLVVAVMEAAHSTAGGYAALRFPKAADVRSVLSGVASDYGSLLSLELKDENAEKVTAGLERLDALAALSPSALDAREAFEVVDGLWLPAARGGHAAEIKVIKQDLSEAKASLSLASVDGYTDVLLDCAKEVEGRIAELKRASSVLGNDDLIELALKAVRDDPTVAADYAGRFRLVMVDEFQDTDDKQHELIRLLSGEGALRLTTVGDVQQSIDRFRGADVTVMNRRGESLPRESHVELAVNYRSHGDVLALVDRVCGGEGGVLDGFMHLDANPKRTDSYQARDLPRIDVELTRGPSSAGGPSKAQCAVGAAMVADRLAAYRDHGESPSGMALLLGSFTHASYYINALRSRGLECVVSGGSTFTSATEVHVVAALLHALANPKDTRSGLFPLLSSEMFGLDANDFVQLGTRRQRTLDAPTMRTIDRGLETLELFAGAEPSPRLARAHEVMARARSAMRRMPVADVCLQAIRESGWLSRLERDADGRAREANVLAAISYIRELTLDLSIGPALAAQEFDRWLEVSKVSPASLAGGAEGLVQIMTVHASKGLEFPVVAIAECWSSRSRSESLVSGKAGNDCVCVLRPPSALRPKDFSKVVKGAEPCDHPRDAFAWLTALTQDDEAADAAERTRLLYVALTRAREALVVSCPLWSTKVGVSDSLSLSFAENLFDATIDAGEHSFSFGGEEPGLVRAIDVSQRTEAGRKVWSASTGGSLAELEGDLPAAEDDIATLGHVDVSDGTDATDANGDAGAAASEGPAPDDGDAGGEFDLFEVEEDVLTPLLSSWGSREGTYSYSSAHAAVVREALERGEALPGSERRRARSLASPEVREAEQQGAPATADADRATGLGSAFHEIAQTMVESKADAPDSSRVEAIARRWHLSPRAMARLADALDRWARSKVRERALAHDHVRAEVPFFASAPSRFGDSVEGAIDLLATDDGSTSALVVDYKTGDRDLTEDEIFASHQMQANFYASVLMSQGFESVECCFVCVEREDEAGEPLVCSYAFDAGDAPAI